MKWGEEKKKEDEAKKEAEEDGGIIQLEPKQQARYGRRQNAN